jgi:hypothetical protein
MADMADSQRTERPMTDGQRLILGPAGSASPEEAAAIVAALERFMRATAPAAAPPAGGPETWQRAAVLEGVARDQGRDASDPWINT